MSFFSKYIYIYIFSNFILQYLIYRRLGFIIYCSLLYTWLARSCNPCHGFGRLTPVLFIFFNWQFFFQFHHSTLGWLGIRFHDLFWFALYKVISVSLLKSRVWRVNLFNSSFYWLFYWIFFYFILQHLVDYELGLMNYFGLLSMGLSRSYARVTCFVG